MVIDECHPDARHLRVFDLASGEEIHHVVWADALAGELGIYEHAPPCPGCSTWKSDEVPLPGVHARCCPGYVDAQVVVHRRPFRVQRCVDGAVIAESGP
jgi:hypothetical protein